MGAAGKADAEQWGTVRYHHGCPRTAEANMIDVAEHTTTEPEEENSISKSQKKRDMLALQDVGVELVGLSSEAINKLELPDNLRTAVVDAKRIPKSKYGGMKRQMQYIGRLMREIDPAPIIEQLNSLKAPNKKQTALHHLAERWRERLLADETALNAFVNAFADADRALLAKHIQGAKDDKAKNKPPKNYRLLYSQIHDLVVAESQLPKE